MITGIKDFFNQFIETGILQSEINKEKALQIATAALLLEMMRMDDDITAAERDSVMTLLRMFALDPGQLKTLIGEQEAGQASGYYQFTSLINKGCDADQKIHIIENLWYVAMSDGHLDAHETHLMRKIASLFHVGHADYTPNRGLVKGEPAAWSSLQLKPGNPYRRDPH